MKESVIGHPVNLDVLYGPFVLGLFLFEHGVLGLEFDVVVASIIQFGL